MEARSGFPLFTGNKSRTGVLFYRLLFTVLLGLIIRYASAQDDHAVNLSSPYHTLSTFLLNISLDTVNSEAASMPFLQKGISKPEATNAALKLKKILDGQGILIALSEIPKEMDYLDSASNHHQYILTPKYPGIFIEKAGSRWLFPRSSIETINELYDQIFPLGIDKTIDLLPRISDKKFLGLHLWQIEAILLVLVLSVIIHFILTFIFGRVIISILHRMDYKGLAVNFVRPIATPISLLVISFLWIIFIPSVQFPALVTRYLILVLEALWPILLTIIFYKLVDVLSSYLAWLALKTESTLDDQLVPLVRKILKTLVVITGALFVLINLDISIIPFITGLSIGGLAFALAAQDTIKNFFGSLMIFIDKPFQVGHWITSGDVDGEVEEVGLRSTRVRTFRNSVIYVPNGKLADSTIDNHGLRVYRRYYTTLNITYDTPARVIEIFIEGLNRIVQTHPYTRKDKYHIFLNDFGQHSLNIMFYIFFQVPTWADELKYRHEIIISILELAESLNVRFAFPTRTLHLESMPEKRPSTPVYADSPAGLRKRMDEFFDENDKSPG